MIPPGPTSAGVGSTAAAGTTPLSATSNGFTAGAASAYRCGSANAGGMPTGGDATGSTRRTPSSATGAAAGRGGLLTDTEPTQGEHQPQTQKFQIVQGQYMIGKCEHACL